MAADNDQLKNEIDALKTQNQTIMERLDSTMDLLEAQAGTSHSAENKTSIHGYGELHYNNIKGKDGKLISIALFWKLNTSLTMKFVSFQK